MDYFKEIKSAIEDSQTSFLDFKNAISARLDLLEVKNAKLNRPRFDASEKTVEVTAETKAFRHFLRTGDDREIKSLAITTNAGADGGYAMPKVLENMIEELVVNISPIRQIAHVVQISTADYHKLVNLRGTASGWAAETAARTASATPTLADVKIAPSDLWASPQATQQMLDDVYFNAETWIADQVATEFGRAEGLAFISGSGTNQPTGFLTGTPVATADASRAFPVLQYVPTGVSANWPASNPADILLTLIYSLKAAYRSGAVFVMNRATLSAITGFKDSSGRYILTPMSQPGVPPMIFGFPVYEAEDMPTIAASSFSVAFGNFNRGYEIVDRIGATLVRDPFSNKPYVGFYVSKRVGGAVVNSEAIKLLKFSVS
jgi:HK97 family phage major capsid protein